MKKSVVGEIARDLIALGGIPFLVLLTARVWILGKIYFPMQFIFGAGFFLILWFAFRGEAHAGLGLMMLVFVILYYRDLQFGILASAVYLAMIWALFYLGAAKKEILKGILFGAVSFVASYYFVGLILG